MVAPLFQECRHAQAHKTVQRLGIPMLLWLSVIAFPVGCGQPQLLATNQSGNETTQDFGVGLLERIDLGVVFADEASYVCFPLSRFGIESAQQIVDVQSSCNCAVPSIVIFESLKVRQMRCESTSSASQAREAVHRRRSWPSKFPSA